MKNIYLPERITRTYFNCIEQQVMTLCYFYHREFWKLFMNQHIKFHDKNVETVEDTLSYETLLFDNAEKYYGIQFVEQEDLQYLKFEKNEIYLAYIDTKYYLYTQDIAEEGIHCILIYGETEEGYVVNDNFYRADSFILERASYHNGIRKLCLLKYNRDVNMNNDCFNEFMDSFLYPSSASVEQAYQFVKKNQMTAYNSAGLIDIVSKISCYIKKDAVMAEAWGTSNKFYQKCIDIFSDLANQAKKIYYAILKGHLMYKSVPPHMLYEKFFKLVHIMRCEERVKREVLSMIQKKDSLKDQLYRQILAYLNIKEIDINTSVYQIHDKYSVIYLLNHLEHNNELEELDYDDFLNCNTYMEFELVIYEKILCKSNG